MKKRYLRAGLTLILSSMVLMSSFSAAAQAAQVSRTTSPYRTGMYGTALFTAAPILTICLPPSGDTEKYGDVIPDSIPPLDSAAVTSSQYLSGTSQETFEAVYDPRTLNLVTPVKYQGFRANCGIFSALASMESFAIKPNKLDKTYDLSENYFDYMLGSNAFGDVRVPYAPEYRPIGVDANMGAREEDTFYSAVLRGAITESEFPYTPKSTVTLEDDSIFHTEPSAYM